MSDQERKLDLELVEAAGQISQLFSKHQDQLEKTYYDGAGKLIIGLIIKMNPKKNKTGIDVETKMSFVAERVRDIVKGGTERQMTIEEAAPKNPLHARAEQHPGGPTGKVSRIKEDSTEGDNGPTEETTAAIAPNEHGVLEVDPTFSYETKKVTADVAVVEYEGRWYHGTHCEVKGAGAHGGLPSVNRPSGGSATAEEELDYAKQELIGSLESIVQSHPGTRPAVKKAIIWAEGLVMPKEAPTASIEDVSGDLEHIVLSIADQVKGNIYPETAGEWFAEVAGKVIEAWFPGFTYLQPRDILAWIDDCAAAEGVPVIDDLRNIMSTMEGYKQVIFRYIEEHGLTPIYAEACDSQPEQPAEVPA